MASEELEFLITQYLDGTLSADQKAAVELQLESDEDGKRLVEEHRKLTAALVQARCLPAINWERLGEHLSAVVAEEEQRRGVLRIVWLSYAAKLAMAACVLLAVGMGLYVLLRSQGTGLTSSAVVQIMGPQAQGATGKALVEVSIGPAGDLQQGRYAENIVAPGSVSLIYSDLESGDDVDQHPYEN